MIITFFVLLKTNRFNLLMILFAFGVVSLGACQSSTQKNSSDATTIASDIPLIELPKPKAIDAKEAERLNKACQSWYDSSLLYGGFNGGMIVAKDGNIVFEKYTGTEHLPGTDFITATTPLQIASVSKTFTAMAVLLLWQQGKLNIDDELSKYLTNFNYPGVTIRSLLNHRSGLPNYLYFIKAPIWDETRIATNEDVLQLLITQKSTLENIAPPNTHFSYCNTNYALLALLVEKVTNTKFPKYLQDNFFAPLQMKNTFVFNIADSAKVAPSYDWKGRLINYNFLDGVYGDKNIYTTPSDLLIWDRALLSGKIFTEETLTHAYAPYSNEKPGIKNYGLGWRMNIYPDGKKMIFHNGWWHGSNASFIRLIKEKATIIVIGNKFTRKVYAAKVLCNLFGDYYTTDEEEEPDNLKAMDSLKIIKRKLDSLGAGKFNKQNEKLLKLFKDSNRQNSQ